MSRGKSVIRGSASRVFAMFAQIAVTLIMTPVILDALGDRYYGMWILAGTFIGYYGLFDFGLSISISRFLSRAIGQNRPEDQCEYLQTGFVIFSVLGLLVLVLAGIFILATPLIIEASEDVPVFRTLVLLLGLSIGLTMPLRVFPGILRSCLRHDLLSAVNLFILVLRNASIYVLLTNDYGIVAMAWTQFICTLLEFVIVSVVAQRHIPFLPTSLRLIATRARELLGYSVYTFIFNVGSTLISQLDSLVITIFRDVALVTPYSLAYRLFAYATDFLGSLVDNITPVFSQDEGAGQLEAMRSKFLITTKIASVFSVMLFSGIAIYGQDFIVRWIGRDYPEIPAVILVLAPAYLLSACQRPSMSILFAVSRHRVLAYILVAEGLVNLLLSVLLVGPYGIIGVAAGSAIPSIINWSLIMPLYVCHQLQISSRSYYGILFGRTLLPLVAFSLIFANLVAERFLTPDYSVIMLLGLLQSTLLLVFAWFVVFSRQERAYLYAFVPKR